MTAIDQPLTARIQAARRPLWRAGLAAGAAALLLAGCGGGGGGGSASLPLTPTPAPAPAPAPAPTPTPTPAPTSFPPSDGTFRWTTSGVLISPQADPAQTVYGVKDPSVVYANGRYHVFLTRAGSNGWSIAYSSFTDWSQAGAATIFPLEKSPIGPGYRAAPEVFYFAPQKLWYLVFQGGDPYYSTTATIDDPMSWSPAKPFFPVVPDIIKNSTSSIPWIDFYVICTDTKCYLFNTDDNGLMMRSETPIDQFPNGFTNTQVVLSDARFDLFEGSSHYRVKGTNTYLSVVEAIGPKGRYFRIWKADGIEGAWVPLGTANKNTFADEDNIESNWAEGASHGELLREGPDQTMTIDPCQPLKFLYQGNDPAAPAPEYIQIPYRIALLTAKGANPITDMCVK